MPDDPTIHTLANKVTKLEGTVKTQHAIYETGIQALRADIADYKADQAKRDADYRESAAKRDAEQSKREADYRTEHQAAISALSEKIAHRENRLTITLIAAIGIATTILGLIIHLT